MIPDTTSNTDSNANSNSNTEASTRNAQTSTSTAVVLTETATPTATATSSIETSQQSQAQRKRQKVQNETTTVATTTPTVTVTTTQNSSNSNSNSNDTYDTIAPITTAATTTAKASIQSGTVETNNTNVVTTVDVYFSLHVGDEHKGDFGVKVEVKLDGTILIDGFKNAVLQQFRFTLQNVDAGSLQVYSGKDSTKSLGGLVLWNAESHGGDPSNPLVVKVEPIATTAVAALSDKKKVDAAIKRGKAFIKSIMKDYEDVPGSQNEMKVLRKVADLETGRKVDVVLRAITEPFWSEVIAATNEQDRVCALGTPGVGKTTTTCILIKLLVPKLQKCHEKASVQDGIEMDSAQEGDLLDTAHECTELDAIYNDDKMDSLREGDEMDSIDDGEDDDKANVIYHVRTKSKKGFVYIFTTSKSDRYVNVNVMLEESFGHLDYNSKFTYYVVDPSLTKDDCNFPIEFLGKVIIVTSPDERHWGGGEFIKDRSIVDGIFRIFPVWKLNELQLAKQYFSSQLTNETIETRFKLLGGVPRHIFSNSEKIDNLLKNQKIAVNQLSEDQVKSMLSGKIDDVDTKIANQPKSIIMVYDDSGETFKIFNPQIVSDPVSDRICNKFGEIIWNEMVAQGVGPGTTGCFKFECYCRYWFAGIFGTKNGIVACKQYSHSSKSQWSSVNANGRPRPEFDNCTVQQTGEELFAEATKTENVLFYSSNASHPFIDALCRKGDIFYGLQMTTGISHSFSLVEMEKYVNLAKETNRTFLMYYLVLPTKLEDFTFNKLLGGKTEKKAVLSRNQHNRWSIYAIAVEIPDTK